MICKQLVGVPTILWIALCSAFQSKNIQNRRISSHVVVQKKSMEPILKNSIGIFGGSNLKMSETAQVETYEFKAEVSRVMDIIINSLYSDRDVFLRELVSNAADACDKKRFLSITEEGQISDCEIRIKADQDSKTIVIEDSGIGMSKDDLINNLGKIAESGTRKFMDALGKGEADVNLIGQFGVGFYSAFLVANEVSVSTKVFQGDGKQWKWSSGARSGFTVEEDTGEPIQGSGTRIVLKLKEEAEEYLDDLKLQNLLKRYSQFISFPIKLYCEKTKYDQVEDPDAEPPKEGETPKMKTVTRTEMEWEQMNKVKPIWLRNPKDVPNEEYVSFYKSTFKAYDDPLAQTHFSLEGQVEFRSVLYVPSVLPFELSRNMFDEASRSMKLYVKRVFISDKFEELLPRWLMFIRGLVDSDDLPLNVSREILQKSKILSIISKRLVKKCIDMFKTIQEDEKKFETFNKNFGKYIKVGVIEDDDNRKDIAPLMTFFTSKSGDKEDSLADYVERMVDGQKNIYYVTGDNKKMASMSPALEKCNKLGYEVIYACEPIDELALQGVAKFQDKEILDVAKENVDLGDVDENEKAKLEEAEKEYENTFEWLKDILGKKVSKIRISKKLTESPAALTQGAYGMSPSMQRYMQAQAVAQGMDDSMFNMGISQAVLEINPSHPIIMSLKKQIEIAPDDEATKTSALLMYDVAALTGGYTLDDPKAFAERVTGMMSQQAGINEGPTDAEVVE